MIRAIEGPRPGEGNAAPIYRPLNSIIAPEAVQEARSQLETYALIVFEPDDIVEVRTLHNGRSYWFAARELADQVELLLRNNNIGKNIHVGANPRKTKGGKSAADVALCRCLFADLDRIDVEEAQRRWRDAGLGEPSLVIESGHGVHIYLRLQDPIAPDKFTEFQKRLIARLDSDKSIHDPPRIMRLPGFWNVKDKDNLVPCRIVEHDEARRVESADLHILLPAPPTSAKGRAAPMSPRKPVGRQPERVYTTPTIRAYLENHGVVIKGERQISGGMILLLDRCPINPEIVSENCTDIGILVRDDGKVSYCNKHNRGQAYTWANVRDALEGRRHALRPLSFPSEALPAPIYTFIEEAAAALACETAFTALPLLAALASAIGNTRTVQIKRSWFEPCILWTVVVSPSGTMKTPAAKRALQFLRAIERRALKEHEAAMRDYQSRLLEFEVALREWKSRGCKQGLEQPEEPKSPVCRRHIVSDITVEALAIRLRNQPRGLVLVRDELAGWIKSFNQYKKGQGGDVQNWLEMHHGGTLVVDRKSGDLTTIHVPHAAVSITGGIQPEVLERTLRGEHIENGLAGRLLIYFPERRAKVWSEADISEQAEHAVAAVFGRLFELQPNEDEFGDFVPVPVPMTDEAKAAFIEFYGEHNAELAEQTGGIVAAFAKLEGYAARFALLIHFLRWAVNDPTLADPDRIDEKSMADGIRVCRWFCNEAKRFYGWLQQDDASRSQDQIVDQLRLMGGRVTVRDWQRKRRHATAEEAETELNGLAKAGLGVWKDIPAGTAGGRPSRVFELCGSGDRDSDKTPEIPRDS